MANRVRSISGFGASARVQRQWPLLGLVALVLFACGQHDNADSREGEKPAAKAPPPTPIGQAPWAAGGAPNAPAQTTPLRGPNEFDSTKKDVANAAARAFLRKPSGAAIPSGAPDLASLTAGGTGGTLNEPDSGTSPAFGGPMKALDVEVCSAVSLNVTPTVNPNILTLAATAASCATPQFSYYYAPLNETPWVPIGSAWTSSASTTLDMSTLAQGSYMFLAVARAQGTGNGDASTTGVYQLGPACRSVNISVSPTGPVLSGQPAVYTATAQCDAGLTPQFSFDYRPPASDFVAFPGVTPWQSGAQASLNTAGFPAAVHVVRVRVRAAEHAGYGEAWADQTLTIDDGLGGPVVMPYPLSADGRYFNVNLLRRTYTPPTASAVLSNATQQYLQDPSHVFDGRERPFTWFPNGNDPNASATLIVDMGQYFSIGAVRPLYHTVGSGTYPTFQSIRLATKANPETSDWVEVVPLEAAVSADHIYSFPEKTARFVELTMKGNGANLMELFVYPSAQTIPAPTSADGYDLGSLASAASTVNDNFFPLGQAWPQNWPQGAFYPKSQSWGPTGDAVAVIDLGARYPVSRVSASFYHATPYPYGGRLESAAAPGAYTNIYDSGRGSDFGHFEDFVFPKQTVRYLRATDYFTPGTGLSSSVLWAFQAFTDGPPRVGYFPLSEDRRYYSVNLTQRGSSASTHATVRPVVFANGAVPFSSPPGDIVPANAIDGDDSGVALQFPGGASTDASATITVDLGEVQSIGAVRPFYTGVYPLNTRIRVASTDTGPWDVVADGPTTSVNTMFSFASKSARFVELRMMGTQSHGLAALAEIQVFPSSSSDPAPSSGSALDLTYLPGVSYIPNSNMGIANGNQLHPTDVPPGFYVLNAAQGAAGDGTVTVDLGQPFSVSEVGLSFYGNYVWPAGGKLETGDGNGTWSTVSDTGRGTPLGSNADGLFRVSFTPRTTRYLRLTGYFDPNVAQGLLSGIEVFGGTAQCTPSCAGKHCGDSRSDGCGGSCTPVCDSGAAGCTSNADCSPGLVCAGHVEGSAVASVCVSTLCATNPQLGGCGYEGAPCGSSCTRNPVCFAQTDCPSGYVCGFGNGYRYGVPNGNVCEPVGCATNEHELGCGTSSAKCGLCECIANCANKHCGDADRSDGCGGQCPLLCSDGDPSGCGSDLDCQAGSYCAVGEGARVGLTAGSNVCLPQKCAIPASSDCGTVTSTCGLCPVAANICVGRACGADPNTGASCGPDCPEGQFCSVTGACVSFEATPPIHVIDSGVSNPLIPPASPPAAALGATPGSFNVTDFGSASYSIPIDVPPGRKDIEPSLAIRYTSTTGNGALGIGWSLDGLSTISRCSHTYAQDGASAPIKLNDEDAFCLDGQRLTEVAPNEYRTEVDTFSKIVRNTTQPLIFKVFAKDGRILTYGESSDALGGKSISPIATLARTWALSRVEDRRGNFMRVRYRSTASRESIVSSSTSELVPDSITYTGFGSAEGDREVKFEYSDTRPDKLLGFQVGGGALSRKLRLDRIKTYASRSLVRQYNLNYELAGNHVTRLAAVQECAGAALICKGPTTFGYREEQGFDAGTKFLPAPPPVAVTAPMYFVPFGTTVQSGTFDILSTQSNKGSSVPTLPLPGGLDMAVQVIPGYGQVAGAIVDLINLFGAGSEQKNWYVRLDHNFVSNTVTQSGRCSPFERPNDHIVRNANGTESLYETCPSEGKVLFIDLDGDGVQDRISCSGRKALYYLARTHGRNIPLNVSDLLQDGEVPEYPNFCASEDDYGSWLAAYEQTGVVSPATAPPEPPFIGSFDVDGDGSANVITNGGTGWSALFFDGATPTWRRLSTDPMLPMQHRYVAFLDANGDGLRDILSLPSFKQRTFPLPLLWLNTGTGYKISVPKFSDATKWAPGLPAYVVDYDHDGFDDLIEPSYEYPPCPNPPAATQAGSGGTSSLPTIDPNWVECVNATKAWNAEAKNPHPWRLRRFKNGEITEEMLPANGAGFPGALGDFDGDGNLDLVTRRPDSYDYFMHKGSGRLQNALETVTDGLERRVDIHYDLKNPEGNHTYVPAGNRFEDDQSHLNIPWDGSCTWPNICAQRADRPLVSSFETSHRGIVGTGWLKDSDTRLQYYSEINDMAGLGRLGFKARIKTVRDRNGKLLSQTTTRAVPLVGSTTQVPINPPYARAMAGLPQSITEIGPHAESALTPLTDNYTQTETTFQWVQQYSANATRPFPALWEKETTVYEAAPTGFTYSQKLFGRTEKFVVDAFGNAIDVKVTSEDYTLGLFPSAVPGSTSTLHIARDFRARGNDLRDWLIGNLYAEDISDQPRCYGGAVACPGELRSRHTDFYYLPYGDLRQVVRAQGAPTAQRTTDLSRDLFGNVFESTVTDFEGRSRSTVTTFDDRGMFPIATTNALNQTTQVRFDDRFGKLTAAVDSNEIGETWSYDEFGTMRIHSTPAGLETVDYEPDAINVSGSLPVVAKFRVVSRQAGGPSATERFNSLGQLVARESSGFNGATVLEERYYDQRNRLQLRSRPHLAEDLSQGLISYRYDDQDQLSTVTLPDSNVIRHEHTLVSSLSSDFQGVLPADGGVVSVDRTTDARGYDTYSLSDREGRIVAVVDAQQLTTKYTYGAFGNKRAIEAPNGRIDRTYDNYGRLVSSTDAAVGGSTTVTYSGFDEVATTKDPLNRTASMQYDDLGRQKRLEDSDGVSTWIYDQGDHALGRLTEMHSPSGEVVSYGYEQRGLLSSVTRTLVAPGATSSGSATVLTTGYHYDGFARMDRVDYPLDGSQAFAVQYEFDAAGNPVRARDALDTSRVYWEQTSAYQGYLPSAESLGNGVVSTREYEPLTGYLKSISVVHGQSSVQNLSYDYDANGNMHSRTDLNSGLEEIFGYDSLDRVSSVTDTNAQITETFNYDPLSYGLNQKDRVGDYTYYSQGRDWVEDAGDTHYTHDGLGNVKTRSGPHVAGELQEFNYTTFGLPSHVALQSGPNSNVDFSYDGGGERVVKKSASGTTYYAGELYQKITPSSGSSNHRYVIYAGGKAVAVANRAEGVTTASLSYIHEDALGSAHTMTSNDGSISALRRFDTFGDSRSSFTGSDKYSNGYTGQEHDDELGLVNMGGRMYDARLGQFMSPDPVIQQPYGQGLNRFAYVFNNPLKYTDPSGYSASEVAAYGVAGGYFAGFLAHEMISVSLPAAIEVGGISAAAAASSATATAAATGIGVAAPGAAASAAGEAVGIATSIAANAYFSSRQTVSAFTKPMPSSRSASAGGIGPAPLGRGSYSSMATSPVQERAAIQGNSRARLIMPQMPSTGGVCSAGGCVAGPGVGAPFGQVGEETLMVAACAANPACAAAAAATAAEAAALVTAAATAVIKVAPKVWEWVKVHARALDNLPSTGKPNSTDVVDRGNGKGTIRDYGPDGKAQTDYDFGHDHGAGDPHAHDWDWSKGRARRPGRPLKPGE